MSNNTDSLDYGKYRQQILRQANLGRRLLRGMPEWWGTIADTLAIASVLILPWLTEHHEGEVRYTLVCLSLLCAFSLLIALKSNHRAQLKERYAYAFQGLHMSLHILRDQMAKEAAQQEPSSGPDLKRCLQEVLGSFANAFSIITGTPCRACIKVITTDPPEGKTLADLPPSERMACCYARTFCRDYSTTDQIGHLPEEPTAAPISHNTAFSFLFSDVQRRCFLGNDLPRLMSKGKYLNTSTKKYDGDDETWSLPYKATIVWPIRRVTEQPGSTLSVFTGAQEIFGYLAVDSPARNVFTKSTDFEVGALLADALYMFVMQHIQAVDSEPSSE